MWLTDSPLCKKCGAEDETSAHILSRCEGLVSLRLAYLGCCFLEPENSKSVSLGAIWNCGKATGLPCFVMGHKGPINIGLGSSAL
jgi:hypothetical protein